jgi:hypothetical protein
MYVEQVGLWVFLRPCVGSLTACVLKERHRTVPIFCVGHNDEALEYPDSILTLIPFP